MPGCTAVCGRAAQTGVWRGTFRSASCFACKGTGKFTFKTAPEKRAGARTASVARKAKAAATALEEFKTEHADVWAWMDGNDFPFAVSMLAD